MAILRNVAWFLLFAAAFYAFILILSLGSAQASPRTNTAPECVHWRVFNDGGAGPLVRWLVCGTGRNGESPARDDTNWSTIYVNGDSLVSTGGCGSSWKNPCIIIWPASPQGVKAAT